MLPVDRNLPTLHFYLIIPLMLFNVIVCIYIELARDQKLDQKYVSLACQ